MCQTTIKFITLSFGEALPLTMVSLKAQCIKSLWDSLVFSTREIAHFSSSEVTLAYRYSNLFRHFLLAHNCASVWDMRYVSPVRPGDLHHIKYALLYCRAAWVFNSTHCYPHCWPLPIRQTHQNTRLVSLVELGVTMLDLRMLEKD